MDTARVLYRLYKQLQPGVIYADHDSEVIHREFLVQLYMKSLKLDVLSCKRIPQLPVHEYPPVRDYPCEMKCKRKFAHR